MRCFSYFSLAHHFKSGKSISDMGRKFTNLPKGDLEIVRLGETVGLGESTCSYLHRGRQ